MKRVLLIVVSILCIVGILSTIKYIQTTTSSYNNKLSVVASFYPLYFFASEIAKDKIQVTNITPSGIEPHDFEPTAQNLLLIQNSQLLILNGGIEPWAQDVKHNLEGKQTKIVEVGTSLMHKQIEEDGVTMLDPHIWLSPNLAITIANNITMELIAIDPANKDFYTKNYAALSNKLDILDKKYQKILASCKSKDIVTSHTAFAYLAETYGLHQIAISGISPEAEPSAQDLAKISQFVKEKGIKFIFFESLVSPKLSETIAQEVGAKTLVLDPIEGLSDDEIHRGKNYFTIMEDNLQNLRLALRCQ